MNKRFVASLLLAAAIASASAIPAYKGLITRTMPDGTTIEIRLCGDENFHFATLADGTIVKESDGYFYYATVSDTGIEATKYKVGQPLPAKAKKFMAGDNATSKKLAGIYKNRRTKRNITRKDAGKGDTPLSTQHGLVILVNFADNEFEYGKEMFENVLNEPGYNEEYATGSAYDFFRDSSYGLYSPVFDVLGPYTLSQDMAYYGGNDTWGDDRNPTAMIVEACQLASADGHDMSQYDYDGDGNIDRVYVFYAGAGEANGGSEDTIWPHQWTVVEGYNYDGDTEVDGVHVADYACSNEISESYRRTIDSAFDGVGTFIHEFGHVLGLPDLYDTNYSGGFFTPGSYDVMDSGSYTNYSRTPPAYSGYERMCLGWIKPQQIYPSYEGTEMELAPITEKNVYLLTSDGTEHNLDGNAPSPKEFYLLEYRDGEGWDKYIGQTYDGMPGDKGMLITRINYNEFKWENNTVNNYKDDMGVSYVCNDSQNRYPFLYYPMFPGYLEEETVEFGNYTISDIRHDEKSGNIRFTISDKTAEPEQGGIGKASAHTAKATGGYGRIVVDGTVEKTEVVNIQGATLYSGNASEIPATPGIYIVKLTAPDGATAISKIAVK